MNSVDQVIVKSEVLGCICDVRLRHMHLQFSPQRAHKLSVPSELSSEDTLMLTG